jgi:hypothetical protein
VVDLPIAYFEQIKSLTTNQHYPPPAGSSVGLVRVEPVVVDPEGMSEDAERARYAAEIAETEARLAELRAHAPPPVPTAPPIGGGTDPLLGANPVFLTPSVTGTRLLATSEQASADRGVATAAQMPGPTGSAESGLPSDARELVSLLTENPDLADAVEAAEQRRAEPRTTVLQAVSRARAAHSGSEG